MEKKSVNHLRKSEMTLWNSVNKKFQIITRVSHD